MSNPIYGNVVGGGASAVKTITETTNIGTLSAGTYFFTEKLIDDYTYQLMPVGTGILIISESIEETIAEGRIIKPFIVICAVPVISFPNRLPCRERYATGYVERVFNGTEYVWKVYEDYEFLTDKNIAYTISSDSLNNEIPTAKVVYDYIENIMAQDVQPDYLQNDSTAKDYIKNRPFYSAFEEIKYIIQVKEYQFLDNLDNLPEGLVAAMIELPYVPMATGDVPYNFTLDNTVTQGKFSIMDDVLIAGNLHLIDAGDDTGEPYCIILMIDIENYTAYAIVYIQDTPELHTFGISYIEDNVPLIADNKYDFTNFYDISGVCIFTGCPHNEGDKYTLTLDGQIYKDLSLIYEETNKVYAAGNFALAGVGDNTGENYCLVVDNENRYTAILTPTVGEHAVCLTKEFSEGEIVHKVSRKYLDIPVPYIVDFENNTIFEGDIYYNGSTSIRSEINNLKSKNSYLENTLQSNYSSLNSKITTTNTNLDNKVTEINAEIDSVNTKLDNKITEVNAEIEGKVTEINTEIDSIDTKIENKITEVSTKFENKITEIDIQSDFTQKDSSVRDYIKNKPRIGQNYIVLTDTENNLDYAICITNGNLITHKVPARIEITTYPTKMGYLPGEAFDPTGMVLTAFYGDGTSAIITEYSYPTEPLNICGDIKLFITTQFKSIPYDIEIIVSVFDLIDFNYTYNDDGTYTLTGWKSTLNGEESTELIIPDSPYIKL